MKLLERLRSQPAWQSDDPAVRAAAVRDLPEDDRDLLLEIARGDPAPGVRRAAVERMPDLATLVAFLRDPGEAGDADGDARVEAQAAVRDTLIEAQDAEAAVGALDVLADERDLAAVARAAGLEALGRAALERLSDDRMVAAVARRAGRAEIALDAVARLTEPDELLSVAVKADDRTAALAACERLLDAGEVDPARLETMVRQARHKGVARRARAALDARSEDREQEAAPPPGADLCARLEARAAAVASLEEGRAALDEAVQSWAAIDAPIDPAVAERFRAGRRALEDRLLALDATAVEEHRAAAERSAAESARAALCERVEGLAGAAAPEGLRQARAEWEALGVDADADAETRAALDALAARFETAAAACEARHAAFLRQGERLRTLDGLVAELEQLAGEPPADRARWRVLELAWRRERAVLAEEDAPPDAGTAEALAALEARKAAVDQRRKAQEVDARAERDTRRQKNLTRANKLVEGIEAALASERLSLAEAERQLRAARRAQEQPSALPSRRDQEQLARRLKEAVGALLGRVRELRDLADWQRWANLGVQEELCREMEALAAPPEDPPERTDEEALAAPPEDPPERTDEEALAAPPEDPPERTDEEVARAFTDLMKRWRLASDVPPDKGQQLWERFRKAHDLVYPRCEPVLAAQRDEREESLARRVALVEEAERLSESTDWLRTAQRLTALQAEWKTLGAAPRKEQQALWGRLRKACGAFFTRRKADLAGRKQEWAANHEKKEALCVRVEALREAEDLKAAIEEVKRVQAEWKTIGPVRRNRSDAIWQRFREACDGVFDRLNEGARQAAAESIAAREALCAELEALAPPAPAADSKDGSAAAAPPAPAADSKDGAPAAESGTAAEAAAGEAPAAAPAPPAPEDPVKAVRAIQDRWRRAPAVPAEIKRKLAVRFSRALARVVEAHAERFRGTEHDPARRLKQLERLCKQAEALVESESPRGDASVSPAELLARKWRAQMAANTMGARVDEGAKRRAAREDVKRLQTERRRLGALTGSEAEALQARFQRACDRVFRQNPA